MVPLRYTHNYPFKGDELVTLRGIILLVITNKLDKNEKVFFFCK